MVESTQHSTWEKMASAANVTQVDPSKALSVIKDSVMESQEGGIHTNNQTTVKQYFHYYSKLVNQQNMLQDQVRT
jgi:hypothetical protein